MRENLLENILKSGIFKSLLGQAPRYAQNTKGILGLIKKAISKTQSLGMGGVVNELREQVVTIGQMLKAYAAGEYKIQNGTLIKLVLALLYFVSPIDFIPDFLPVLGFTDDLALILWIVNSLNEEIALFKKSQKF